MQLPSDMRKEIIDALNKIDDIWTLTQIKRYVGIITKESN